MAFRFISVMRLGKLGRVAFLFSNLIQMPFFGGYNSGNKNYTNEWVQLINSYSVMYQTNDGSGAWYQLGPPVTNSVLDTTYPYTYFYPTWNETVDAPSVSLVNATNAPYRAVSYSAAFTMYLLFQPTNGSFVPIAKVDWNWIGSAALNQVATNGNYWSLTGSSHSPNARVKYNATGYPQWSDNVTAHKQLITWP